MLILKCCRRGKKGSMHLRRLKFVSSMVEKEMGKEHAFTLQGVLPEKLLL